MNKTLVLNDNQIIQKIKRIAHEIYESNFEEKDIVLCGIVDNGLILSNLINSQLKEIASFSIELISLKLNKKSPTQSDVELSCNPELLKNKVIILIDDVQNTGRTLAYSLRPFLSIKVKKIQTCVLIDRKHNLFPVATDFVGYLLSTTLNEHIEVDLTEKTKFGVYLH